MMARVRDAEKPLIFDHLFSGFKKRKIYFVFLRRQFDSRLGGVIFVVEGFESSIFENRLKR